MVSPLEQQLDRYGVKQKVNYEMSVISIPSISSGESEAFVLEPNEGEVWGDFYPIFDTRNLDEEIDNKVTIEFFIEDKTKNENGTHTTKRLIRFISSEGELRNFFWGMTKGMIYSPSIDLNLIELKHYLSSFYFSKEHGIGVKVVNDSDVTIDGFDIKIWHSVF